MYRTGPDTLLNGAGKGQVHGGRTRLHWTFDGFILADSFPMRGTTGQDTGFKNAAGVHC